MDDLLYFNGVNGATGEYGLESQTAQELYEHVTDYGTTDSRREALANKLAKDTRSTDKVKAIVRLLAESNVQDVRRDAAWRESWTATLAQELAATLLGPPYTEPDQVKAIQERLKSHTTAKVVRLVELLLTGDKRSAAELTAILLQDQDLEPDNALDLRDKLKKDAEDKIIAIKDALFFSGDLENLATDPARRDGWIEALIARLRELPIKSLRSVGQAGGVVGDANLRDIITGPCKTLVAALKRLKRDALAPLIAALESQDTARSWDRLLDALDRELTALSGENDSLWDSLPRVLDEWLNAQRERIGHLGPIEGVDPTDLARAGWGIIFPFPDAEQDRVSIIKEKLKCLLDWRKEQAGELYKVYEGENGYQFDDTASRFVARASAAVKGIGTRVSDPVNPNVIPYYLLIVGSPGEIPFHFQYQLDVQYAVGRIDFGDDFDAYERYARSVVAAEKGEVVQSPRAAFVGVSNPGDRATAQSTEHLVKPLVRRFREKQLDAPWQIAPILREGATKEQLQRLIVENPPTFLFTASHGVEFDKDDPAKQRQYQGALLCQDWKGGTGEIPKTYYLAGDDLSDDANLTGMIAFLFACYGAGTPRYDEYSKQAFKRDRKTIADEPFVAALPQAMLSHPQGGALAVIGHVERAWATSFLGDERDEYVAVFESTIERLFKGHPVGWAMEYFNGQYAALSTELTSALDSLGAPVSAREIAEKWIANNDARGYVVIGDPAVRLPVAKTPPRTKKRIAGTKDDDWF